MHARGGAGGGAGGTGGAGCGGGGGGMIEVSDYPVSVLTYPIVVGGGGLGSAPQEPGAPGNNGSDSRFNNPANNSIDVVSRGGGAGGASSNSPDVAVRDGTGGGSCGGVGSKNGLNPKSGPAINTHPNNPTIAALAIFETLDTSFLVFIPNPTPIGIFETFLTNCTDLFTFFMFTCFDPVVPAILTT